MGSIGIYVNPKALLAYRASTPYAAPDDPSWVLVSDDSMIGMAQVRALVRERHLVEDADAIQWTGRLDAAAAKSGDGVSEPR